MSYYSQLYFSPIGNLFIHADEKFVRSIEWTGDEKNTAPNIITEKCVKQLSEYFDGMRTEFDVPLLLKGTPFQEKVWRALLEIPYGETRSYADIAQSMGSPKAARAVGNANNHNNIPVIIPCHRVVRADSSLGGYAGGIVIKQFLLDLESQTARP